MLQCHPGPQPSAIRSVRRATPVWSHVGSANVGRAFASTATNTAVSTIIAAIMRIIFLEVQIWPGGAEHWLVSKQQVTNTSSERSDPDADFPSGLSNNADASPTRSRRRPVRPVVGHRGLG